MRWEFVRLFTRSKENFGKSFEDLWYDLKSAARELFIQIPHDIKYFFRNVWAFKGFLWQDRDWDYAYILRALQLKIRKTRTCIERHGHHANAKKDVKNMIKAEEMIQAILEDDHGKALDDAHDAKWGPSMSYHVPVVGSSSTYWRTDRPNVRTDEDRKQERLERRIVFKKTMKLEQKAWSNLWKHLDKHMACWWD